MIPKTIHYIWFGSSKLPKSIKMCINSWRNILEDYDSKCWSENNVILDCTFAKEAYSKKKWAFLSDYLRLRILYDFGGIYLDTDMLVIKSFNTLLDNDIFFGKESDTMINGAIIGAKRGSEFIRLLIDYYRSIKLKDVEPIPIIISKNLKLYSGNEKIQIYPVDYFYPFPYDLSYEYKVKPLLYRTENTFAIHLWHKSWKTDMYKFTRAKNHIGALGALFKLIRKTPFSLKLWQRLPGTMRLAIKQILKSC